MYQFTYWLEHFKEMQPSKAQGVVKTINHLSEKTADNLEDLCKLSDCKTLLAFRRTKLTLMKAYAADLSAKEKQALSLFESFLEFCEYSSFKFPEAPKPQSDASKKAIQADADKAAIGARIKDLRILHKMSQEELGTKLGVNRAAVNKYEKGTVVMPVNTVLALCGMFKVSPNYLLLGSEDLDFPKKRAEERPGLSDNEAKILRLLQGLSEEGFLRIVSYTKDMLKLFPKSSDETKGYTCLDKKEQKGLPAEYVVIDPDDERKVGTLVQQSLAILEKIDFKFTAIQIKQMQSLEWSKKNLKLTYAFIKPLDESKPITEQRRDHLGNGRYYSHPYAFDGKKYLVTSEWYEKNRALFINWYNKLS